MTDSTHFHSPLPGAALIQEARAARQQEQDERVRAHIRAILSRLKSRRPPTSQDPRSQHGALTEGAVHARAA
jgi:hypothetical protein